jgi:DNA-directed RNA polymerase subunit RPC12/RpoP
MPGPLPEEVQLVIRCPSCGQRFKVGDTLKGRTVECGACEHRFRIMEEVIIRGKKIYPGEKGDIRRLNFQRVPASVSPPLIGAEVAQYAPAPNPLDYEPAPPQRILAGIVGVSFILLIAALLILGARSGGALDGMITPKRMMIAGFAAIIGTALLVYANPRARFKALMVGLLLGGGLVSLPLVFTEASTPLVSSTGIEDDSLSNERLSADDDGKSTNSDLEELRALVGTEPLEVEIKRLEEAGVADRAVGLWLRDMSEQHRFLIMDYILRTTGADQRSHFYPRGHGDFLLVITGIRISVDEVARIAEPIGSVEKVHQEIPVIEVKVANENFIEGPIESLTNRQDPEFYDLNKRELDSIDLGRSKRAVQRLAEAEPTVLRSDITRRLLALLEMPDVDFKSDICRALELWSSEPGPAGEAALRQASQLIANRKNVPSEMISLALAEKTPGLAPVIHTLWEQNPSQWEQAYRDLGPEAENMLLRQLMTAEGVHLPSAVRLLGRVGGSKSLPALQAALIRANPEIRVLIEKSIESIRARPNP